MDNKVCFIVTDSRDIIYGFVEEDCKNFVSFAAIKDGCMGYPTELTYSDLWLTTSYSKPELISIARLKDQSEETFERKTAEIEDKYFKFLAKNPVGCITANKKIEIVSLKEDQIPMVCAFFYNRKLVTDDTQVFDNKKCIGTVKDVLRKVPNEALITVGVPNQPTLEILIQEFRSTGNDSVATVIYEQVKPYMDVIASKYRGHHLDADDLASCCSLGFTRALKSYDPEMGTKFVTYLTHAVDNTIRVDLTRRKAQFFGYKMGTNHDLDFLTVTTLSTYDAEVSDEASYKKLVVSMKDAIATLPKLEQYVINNLYFENKTLEDIGTTLGCTRQNVSLIHIKALETLRLGKHRDVFEDAKLAFLFNKKKPL